MADHITVGSWIIGVNGKHTFSTRKVTKAMAEMNDFPHGTDGFTCVPPALHTVTLYREEESLGKRIIITTL